MKMDTSFWTNLNSNINCGITKKQFYGQYLCKLVMELPCGRLVKSMEDLTDELRYRKQTHINRNYGGSWGNRQSADLEKASVEQLEIVRSIKQDYSDIVKIRIEEPYVQFYARDEHDLKIITSRFTDICKQRLIQIETPIDKCHADKLKSGDIFMSTNIGYSHKVYIRDGLYPMEVKQQLLSYLDNLGSDVKLSKGTRKQLEGPLSYIWGNFFYIKDPKLTTFIALIHPSLIRKIHKLEVLEQ